MILATLAGFGLNFIKDLITDNGEDLVKEGIKKVTGIDLNKKKELTPEEVAVIRDAELKLKELNYKELLESNRHEEHYEDLEVSDKQNARGADHLFVMQAEIGKTIFLQTSMLIPSLILIDVLLSVYTKDLGIDGAIHGAISTLIGIALNNAYRERQSLIEFLFGSSVGSKMKYEKGK